MHTVLIEQDGDGIATITTHGADEEDARAGCRRRCDAFFLEYPNMIRS
jgi:hypothetical protein